ncbi:hypothetical protein [Massilia sp. TS11]|uniref:hypothetical protein n=1 Tax=Massilia sp. TS11 TaxID=2908003 RepID=UPI001EDA061C|nr:hypothetical protein [Massilia sp. TS11]MCG2585954.1 hypothetical protein [Massilia sp. TS11]
MPDTQPYQELQRAFAEEVMAARALHDAYRRGVDVQTTHALETRLHYARQRKRAALAAASAASAPPPDQPSRPSTRAAHR